MLVRPAAERWLAGRRVWKAVISVNAVAMTLFAWHMTALVAVLGLARAAGYEPPTEPTAGVVGPATVVAGRAGSVLALLVRLFARMELGRRVTAGDGVVDS